MLLTLFCQVREQAQPLDLDRRAMSINGLPPAPTPAPGGSCCLLIKLRDDKPFAALSSH